MLPILYFEFLLDRQNVLVILIGLEPINLSEFYENETLVLFHRQTCNNKPGTAQVGAISKAQKDSKTKTIFSTTGDNKSSQKTKN